MTFSDWRALVTKRLPPMRVQREPEIVDELAQHLADLYAEARAEGRSEADARAMAEAALPASGEQLAGELVASGRTLQSGVADSLAHAIDKAAVPQRASWMSGFRRDLLVAIRTLVRSRGFTATALLTLAIGIGATSAIFAAVDAILLRPMRYPHADRLMVPVSLNAARKIDNGSITFADYMDWRVETGVFEAVALWEPLNVDVTEYGQPERVLAARVSEEFFRLADPRFVAGRGFVAADHAGKAPRVTVISYELWQRRFGGEPTILGKTIRIAGTPFEIVGILPPRGIYPDNALLFIPLRPELLNADIKGRRDNMIFQGIARLKDGVSREQGNAVLATIAARLERELPGSRAGWTNELRPLRDYLVETDLRLALFILFGAVGAVLLIGCINLASLVLVRGIGRTREIGLRFALGASRWRIVRQQLAEMLVLAVTGAAAGLLLAHWMMQGLIAIAPDSTPFVYSIGLNWRVLIATTGFAVLAVLIAGVMPAFASTGIHLGAALKEGSPGAGSARRTMVLRRGLIVVEIAGAVTLVTASALLIRSFDRVMKIDPGVDVDRVLTAQLSLPGARYPSGVQARAFVERLTDRLSASTGVAAAAATSFIPVGGGGFGLGRVFLAEGWPEPPAVQDVGAQWNVITPDYFKVMGQPILSGRPFTKDDRDDTTPVIIVSKSFATRMFGDANPLGRRTRSWRDENVLREIVGVVDEVRYESLTAENTPLVYVPHNQNSWGLMNIVLRAERTVSPESLTPILRREIGAVDPQLAVSNIKALTTSARESIASERYTTLLLSLLAATAVLLGGLGIYGVVAHSVTSMRHEIGVRIALGARRSHLYGLVFGGAARMVALGLALGFTGAYFASRALATLLFETRPTDAPAYLATVGVILSVCALATFLPARRAARSDAVSALRAA